MTFLFNLIISKAAPVSYLKDLSEKRMRKSAKKKPCKTQSFRQSTLAKSVLNFRFPDVCLLFAAEIKKIVLSAPQTGVYASTAPLVS